MNSNEEKQGKTKARMTDQADKPRAGSYVEYMEWVPAKAGKQRHLGSTLRTVGEPGVLYGPMRKKKRSTNCRPISWAPPLTKWNAPPASSEDSNGETLKEIAHRFLNYEPRDIYDSDFSVDGNLLGDLTSVKTFDIDGLSLTEKEEGVPPINAIPDEVQVTITNDYNAQNESGDEREVIVINDDDETTNASYDDENVVDYVVSEIIIIDE